MDTAVSLIRFKSPLLIRGDILGTRWPLPISTGTELVVPRVDPLWTDAALVSPDLPGADEIEHADGAPSGWGVIYWYARDEPSAAVVALNEALLVARFPTRLSLKEGAARAEDVQDQAEYWTEKFLYWLDIRLCLRVAPLGHVQLTGPSHASLSWLHETAQGWSRLNFGDAHHFDSDDPDYEPYSRDDWEQSVRAVAEDREVPPEWRLLESALRSCRADQYRVAVLDAATATELVLADLVRSELRQEKRSGVVSAIESRLRSIGEKARFLNACGVPLPANLQADLADLRNQVIHRDRAPTPLGAAVAVNLARTVLREFSPLPRF